MKNVKTISLIVLVLCLLATADLGYNFFASLIPGLNDGIAIYGVLPRLIFGDNLWSIAGFFNAFAVAMWITVAVAIENIIIYIFDKKRSY